MTDYLDQVEVNSTTYDLQDSNLKSALEQLDTATAKTSGDYPELTSGTAGQMLSNNGVTDKVPYVYRKSGGEGADRAKESIVGGTVCWNQVFNYQSFTNPYEHNGITYTTVGEGIYNITGTASAGSNCPLKSKFNESLIAGHVYLFNISGSENVKITDIYSAQIATATSTIKKWNSISRLDLSLSVLTGAALTNVKKSVSVHDLTAMFGSTIADYINTLETATAGSGIALLRSWGFFTKPYYAYNAGELMSVQTSGKVCRGFNLFDKSTAASGKTFNSSGEVTSGSYTVSDYIRVLPSTQYYITYVVNANNGRTAFTYDANKNVIALKYVEPYSSTATTGAIITESYAAYIRIAVTDADNACFNLYDAQKNGTYYPYESHTYALDSSLTLRGIPKLDANNSLYYDGDTYEADGAVTRKYGTATFNGGSSESWTLDSSAPSGYYRFYISKGDMRRANYATGESYKNIMICDKCEVVSDHGIVSPQSTYCITGYRASASPTTNWVYFLIKNDQGVTDASTLKTWLASHPITIVYQLKASTTEAADPFQPVMLLNEYGTEEFIDAGVTASTPTRDVSIPVGHDTWYPQNSRAKLDGLPSNFSTLIAPTEATYKATQNYSSGDLFIVNNVLYKATANIANAGTITPGTNCTATTLAAVIAAIA